VLGRTIGNSDTQDSPRPGLGGSHHLPPYSILYTSPWGPHPKGFLSQDSQVGVLKLPKLGLSRLWGAITFWADLRWRWGLKRSCSFHQELSNDMLHDICTPRNQVDSWLLEVGSQIANLTRDPSFGHILCFRCANERCKLILNIQVSRDFQWYKEHLKPLSFDPCNYPLKIQEFTGTPSHKWELPLKCEGSLLHTFLHSWEHAVWLLNFLLARNLTTPLPWSWAQN